jgi:hypothetical protein
MALLMNFRAHAFFGIPAYMAAMDDNPFIGKRISTRWR